MDGRKIMVNGVLYGVGVGPGDPELVTLKALRIIRDAPVLAYPAPDRGDAFARRIVAPHIDHAPIEYPIRTPMTPGAFPDAGLYDQAASDLSAHLSAGRDVACLCEGDPFIYGSFQYLFTRMADDHQVVMIPGVTSIVAGACAGDLPLTAGNDVLAVLPATLPDDALRPRIAAADSVVFLKLGRHAPRLKTLLSDMGRLGDALYVERATLDEQRVAPFADVEDAPYFSLVLLKARR